MHRQTVAAAVVGLVIGAALFARWTPVAPAQQPPADQTWEFLVVDFSESRPTRPAERLADLYAEGWEYVGLLSAGAKSYGAPSTAGHPETMPTGTVAFKRLKRDAPGDYPTPDE